MKTKLKLPKKPNLKKECDLLWSEIIKLRAGYKSEYSGKAGRQIKGEEILNAHHLAGKPNFRLRYELENGICLTVGEHKFIAHHTGREHQFRENVKKLRGADIYDRMEQLRYSKSSSLKLIKVYLEEQLKQLKAA